MEQQTFEQYLEQLKLIIKTLESPDLSLEDGLKYFEEGIKISQKCSDYLRYAEQKVEILTKANQEKLESKPFSPNES